MSESEASKDSAWEGEERRKAILEQYKLYVDIADRAAARRMTANAWWMSIQTAILGGAVYSGMASADAVWRCSALALSLTGALTAALWWLWLRSYRRVAHHRSGHTRSGGQSPCRTMA